MVTTTKDCEQYTVKLIGKSQTTSYQYICTDSFRMVDTQQEEVYKIRNISTEGC